MSNIYEYFIFTSATVCYTKVCKYVVPICWFSSENNTAVFQFGGQKEQVQSQVHENIIQGSVAGSQPCVQGT